MAFPATDFEEDRSNFASPGSRPDMRLAGSDEPRQLPIIKYVPGKARPRRLRQHQGLRGTAFCQEGLSTRSERVRRRQQSLDKAQQSGGRRCGGAIDAGPDRQSGARVARPGALPCRVAAERRVCSFQGEVQNGTPTATMSFEACNTECRPSHCSANRLARARSRSLVRVEAKRNGSARQARR